MAIQLAAVKAKGERYPYDILCQFVSIAGLAAGLIVENTFTSIMDMAGPLASKARHQGCFLGGSVSVLAGACS